VQRDGSTITTRRTGKDGSNPLFTVKNFQYSTYNGRAVRKFVLRKLFTKMFDNKFHDKLSDDDFPIVSFFFKFFAMRTPFSVGKYSAAAF
jgi:hypothetical protein